MICFLVRGIFNNWKTPVFLEFDKLVTKKMVEEVILELENVGLKVRGCSFDLGKIPTYLGVYFIFT